MAMPHSCCSTEKSSVNHRRLASEFGLLDNFYVNGDVSADGHNWSAGAISPDVTNKIHPNMYAGRGARMSLYWGRPPQNFTEEAARPHGGYLWTRAFEAGVSVRNYGWMTKARGGGQDRRTPDRRRRKQATDELSRTRSSAAWTSATPTSTGCNSSSRTWRALSAQGKCRALS